MKAIKSLSQFLLLVSAVCIISCNNAGKAEPANKDNETATTDTAKATIQPAAPPSNFKHQTANVNGVNIHYVIGGEGEPLVLIHGVAPLEQADAFGEVLLDFFAKDLPA